MSSAYYMTFESEDSYNRHISKVERAAAARALDLAADEIESRRNVPGLVHLDVRYGGYYTGIRSGMESDSKALRARAAEIRGAALALVTEEGDKE